VQELTGPHTLAAVRDAFPNHNVFGAACSKPYCALLVSTAIPAEPLQLDLGKGVGNRAVAARLTTPDGVFAVLTIHGDANGITTTVLEKFRAKCEEDGIDHVLVMGDLQASCSYHCWVRRGLTPSSGRKNPRRTRRVPADCRSRSWRSGGHG